MASRANLRFGPYPTQRPASGRAGNNDSQGCRRGTRTRNHLVEGNQSPVPQNVFFQQGSQGPIFNGPIAGGLTRYHAESSKDALQILYNHSATGAMHDSDERFPPPLCHPGTREAVVIRIKDWYGYQQGSGKSIMWVHAPAGYGKTAIAGTISKMLEETAGLDFSPLGATFFFWRMSPERNSPARFIITIAYQLAMSIPELAPHVDNAVKGNPMILRKALEVQLVKLIVEPFKALGDIVEDMPNRLVIIDGLDECIDSGQESRVEKQYAEDQEKVQVQVLKLIHTLVSHRLPLSYLILSRPEAWIKQHIESSSFTDSVEVLDLYAVGGHMNDVEKFVRAELSRIAASIGDKEWPTENIVQGFTRRTNGHILYASTVIRHIDNLYGDPRKRLTDILEASAIPNIDLAYSTPFSSLYELYRQILRSCPEGDRSLMIELLEDIIVASDYFHEDFGLNDILPILDALSSREAGSGARAIRGLHAVLRHTSNPDQPRRSPRPSRKLDPFIHSSFVEFLTNPIISLEFAVDNQRGTRRLLWKCLECLSTITSQLGVEERYLQFALRTFQSFWVKAWSSEDYVRLQQDEYVEVVKKLLTVDLRVCLIKLFGHGRRQEQIRTPYFISGLDRQHQRQSSIEPAFVRSLEHLPKESGPLAQQAIFHVLCSTDDAIRWTWEHHRLLFKQGFGKLPLQYLETLYDRSVNSNQWKSEEVVVALAHLRTGLDCSPTECWHLSSYIRPILDYIRQDNT